MMQNPEWVTDTPRSGDIQQKSLDMVVNTLLKKHSRFKNAALEEKTYDALFKDIKQVLSEYDASIGDCKKYNEARIHRKYERRIQELENEVKNLNLKVKQLQKARSPSKRYIDDLVNKLVYYKTENDKLILENQKVNRQLNERKSFGFGKEPEGTIVQDNIKESNNLKVSIKSKQSNIRQIDLKEEIEAFLRQKEIERRIQEKPKTKLHKFLKKNIENMNQWTFTQFLQQIDMLQELNCFDQIKSTQKLRSGIIMSTYLHQSPMKKLPKLSNFPSSPQSTQLPMRNLTDQYRTNRRKRKQGPDIKNYSTLQVINRVRQKFVLK